MGDRLNFSAEQLLLGGSLLRTAGNFFLLCLLALIGILILIFPAYPRTESGWVLVLGVNPPGLIITMVSDEWLKGKYPSLRMLVTPLLAVVWAGSLVWVIHDSLK